MKTLQLLIVSPDAGDTTTLTRAAGQQRFTVTAVRSEEVAVENGCRMNFEVVIAGKALSPEAVKKLRAFFKAASPDTAVLFQDEYAPEDLVKKLKELYFAGQQARLQHIAVNDQTDPRNLEKYIRFVN